MTNKDCVASRARERFDMTEVEYLTDRINRGYSARAIAKEIGFSVAAICARLRKIAEPETTVWKLREAA